MKAAWEMHVRGMTYREIAAAFDPPVSPATATHWAGVWERGIWPHEYFEDHGKDRKSPEAQREWEREKRKEIARIQGGETVPDLCDFACFIESWR